MAKKVSGVTPISTLKTYSEGAVVDLPPFSEGTEFRAKLRRPSMIQLVKKGKIPNALLGEANKMFASGPASVLNNGKNKDAFDELMVLFDAICEASFVEPTYQELKDAGIELTDDQLVFVFSYSQQGVDALKSFRVQSGNATVDRGVCNP